MNTLKRINLLAIASVLTLSMIISAVVLPQAASAYAGGNGSLGNPWQIANCTQLNQMGYEWTDGESGDSYTLANDINCAGIAFESVKFGEGGAPFSGSFNGAGYTISNLTISRNTDQRVGLFSTIDSAEISDVTFSNAVISGSHIVGPLAGYANLSSIENVHVVSGTITGMQSEDGALGGLVGVSRMSDFENVSSNANVGGYQTFGNGGLIGETYGGSVYRAHASGTISGYRNIGGLIGFASHNTGNETIVSESFATGSVTADDEYAGGLIGNSNLAYVSDSYARGNVTASNQLGGIVGYNGLLLERTYATGQVSAADAESIGGLAGSQNEAEIRYSFWDEETSLMPGSAGGTNKTTEQMKTSVTFTTDLEDDAWDFEEVWGINSEYNDGYPCLLWSAACGANAGPSEGGSQPIRDGDNDGISSEVENAGPNNGDANNDGIADNEQANVASFVNSLTGKYVAVAVDDVCTLSEVSANAESNNAAQDSGYSYDTGFVKFNADCGTPGYTTNVQVYFYGADSSLTVRKYNSSTNAYFTIAQATKTDVTIGDQAAVLVGYTATDGGILDVDGTENGIIIDPVGLGSLAVGAPNTGLGGKN